MRLPPSPPSAELEPNRLLNDACAIWSIADSATFFRSSNPTLPVVMAFASALSIVRPARVAPSPSGPSSWPRIVATSRANDAVSARTLTTSWSIVSSIPYLVVPDLIRESSFLCFSPGNVASVLRSSPRLALRRQRSAAGALAPVPPASSSRTRPDASRVQSPRRCTASQRPRQTAHPEPFEGSSPLKDLRQHQFQQRSDLRQPPLDHRLADPRTSDGFGSGLREMIEQRRDLVQLQRTGRSPLDQLEQRSKLLLGRDQRAERRPQQQLLATHIQAGFAAIGICGGHSATTSPELSSASV